MLRVQGVVAGYGGIRALKGVSLEVGRGEMVAIIGANGAGKSTLLRTISGLIRPSAGEIWFEDEAIHGAPPAEIARRGLVHIPEGPAILGSLTVRENLELGTYLRREPSARIRADLDAVLDRFPILRRLLRLRAAALSGGEQRMLALGRALVARPRLMMLDEPSLGLAPMIVAEVFRVLESLRAEGRTILLVEQNARKALEGAHRAYVLETGTVVLSGPAPSLLRDPGVQAAYLGTWETPSTGSR